jgi:predicted phage terminase large subunit-like protein
MFRRDWFERVERHAVPEVARAVRYWDFASSQPTLANPDPDYTVGLRLELDDRSGIYYITGIVRRRLHAGQIQRLVRATAEADGPAVPIYLEEEPASNSRIMADQFKRELLNGYPAYSHRPSGSKEARARAIAAAAENGYVKLVPGPNSADFLDEIAAFPNSPHDDCLDALTGAHHALGARRNPNLPRSSVPRGSIFDYGLERPGLYRPLRDYYNRFYNHY